MNFAELKEVLERTVNGVKFVVPSSREEIKAEGDLMFNALQCAGYDKKHFSGEKIIVIAKREGENKDGKCNHIDMLVENGKTIMHAVCWGNANIGDEEFELMDAYATAAGLTVDKRRIQDAMY